MGCDVDLPDSHYDHIREIRQWMDNGFTAVAMSVDELLVCGKCGTVCMDWRKHKQFCILLDQVAKLCYT